ncbi:MAG: zinc-ribbon domain-containing protein [Bacteroidales bacterium]|nr:zinc-ribbon domain-containing protein [Bacteroidales bacterium]
MKICTKCGAQVADGIMVCPQCGAPMMPPPQSPQNDAEQNKVMGILAYLGILVLVPIFAAKESKFARFHANQGLLLCIAAIAYLIAMQIVLAVMWRISWTIASIVSVILPLAGLVFLVLAIMGIINAVKGEFKELPIIGKYRILK